MKSFVQYTRRSANSLRESLHELRGSDCDIRIALTHFSPVEDTLAGEPREIYPFLGSYLLAEAVDDAGADLAIHGHAHMRQGARDDRRGDPGAQRRDARHRPGLRRLPPLPQRAHPALSVPLSPFHPPCAGQPRRGQEDVRTGP